MILIKNIGLGKNRFFKILIFFYICLFFSILNAETSFKTIKKEQFLQIKILDKGNIKSGTISTLYNINEEINGFKKALEAIKAKSEKLISEGVGIIILSDKGVDNNMGYLPALLVAGTIHHHLIRKNLRDLT